MSTARRPESGNPHILPSSKVVSRMTRAGRKLTYVINVIQQPARARACGSGAKSSADRRPVDPPPVVELRIYDGDDMKNDITFAYKANFFLFATLESLRPIAHGRAHPSPPQIPVLTGMPVSGMAYLDRPAEAGYFIFPDLSVRHEGNYALSFNLYEEVGDPEIDGDPDSVGQTNPKMSGPHDPNTSFDWRLTISSDPFIVYSAKKFPGLAESTNLSRVVAEQGCRVRIRRDVRMRRRDKGANDFEENPTHDAEDAWAARPGRSMEQSHEAYRRERSNSAGSDEDRRISGGFPDQQSQQSAYNTQNTTPSPSQPHTVGPHLGFGGQQAAPPFAQPPPPPAPAPYQSHGYSQPQYPQHHQGPPPPPQHQLPAGQVMRHGSPPYHSPQSQSYPQDRQYAQPPYASVPSRDTQMYDDANRRPSVVGYQPNHPPQPQFQPVAESTHQHRPPFQGYNPPSPPLSHKLPPLKVPNQMSQGFDGPRSPRAPLSSISRVAPPFPGQLHGIPHIITSPHITPSQYPLEAPPPLEPMRNGGKRSYDSTFPSASMHPLSNRQRPDQMNDEDDAEDPDITTKMVYRRAGGTTNHRLLPPKTV